MRRRAFLTACAMIAGISGVRAVSEVWSATTPRLYARSRLVDIHGEPVRTRRLASRANYVFNYPFTATPCFLLDLGKPVNASPLLSQADGATYAWSGGVGPAHSVVAYSAICAHKLAYPTRE